MPIGVVIDLLTSFQRYLDFINNNGYDEVVVSVKSENNTNLIITLRGHLGETYDLEVYKSLITRELCIENPEDHTSIFDFAEENNMSVSDVKYIKFGK